MILVIPVYVCQILLLFLGVGMVVGWHVGVKGRFCHDEPHEEIKKKTKNKK